MTIYSFLLAIVVCTVWGAGFSLMKVGLRYLPPFYFVGVRFFVTAVIVGLYARALRIELRVPRAMLTAMALLTVLFYAQQGLIFTALSLTRAGRVGVILNTQPIITAIMAHWFVRNDRLTRGKTLGLFMAVCGVTFVFRASFTDPSRDILVGDAFAFLAAILWGVQTVVAKHVVKHVTPDAMIGWQSMFAGLLFFASSTCFDPAPIPRRPLDPTFFGAMGYIVLVGTVFGFVAWVYLLHHNNPSQVASFCFITPIASVLFARVILRELLTVDLAIAALLVGAGIFVANFRAAPPAPGPQLRAPGTEAPADP